MYKPKEFAKKIGVSVSTLRRWDKEKRLVPLRTQTNHRVYTDDDIFKVLNLKKPSNQGKIVVYCMDLKNTKSKSNRWLKKIHDIRTHDRTCSQ